MKTKIPKANVLPDEVQQLNTNEVNLLKSGEVLLVRSKNVPERGDHFILVTGPPIQKPHGWRVRTEDYPSTELDTVLLDQYKFNHEGVIALRLNCEARDRFHKLFNIIA